VPPRSACSSSKRPARTPPSADLSNVTARPSPPPMSRNAVARRSIQDRAHILKVCARRDETGKGNPWRAPMRAPIPCTQSTLKSGRANTFFALADTNPKVWMAPARSRGRIATRNTLRIANDRSAPGNALRRACFCRSKPNSARFSLKRKNDSRTAALLKSLITALPTPEKIQLEAGETPARRSRPVPRRKHMKAASCARQQLQAR